MCGRQPLKNLMEYDLPKAEDLEECFEPLKFSAFGRWIGLKLKKLDGFFSKRRVRRISNQEVWIVNETRLAQVVLQ